jgi:hypothetical protein
MQNEFRLSMTLVVVDDQHTCIADFLRFAAKITLSYTLTFVTTNVASLVCKQVALDTLKPKRLARQYQAFAAYTDDAPLTALIAEHPPQRCLLA